MIGKLTRTYRGRLAISQEELAERAGVSSRAVRAIETGRRTPRPATVRLLADALRLSGQERDDYCASIMEPTETPTDPDEPTARVVDDPARARVPRGLPLPVSTFAGRGAYLDQLTALLNDGRPGAVVVSGTAGVGKTTFAVHWAHQNADRFPDGQLFVDLRGFGPAGAAVSPGAAILGLLQALEVPAGKIPADLAGQVALYRTILAGRRILVLADNARDAEQVRPLIPGTSDCLVLVTSRRQLTSLVAVEGAVAVPLDLPTRDEARTLLTARLGARRVVAEPVAVDAMIDRCARLPLALAVVAARATLRPHFSLASIVEQLGGADNRLDRLQGGDAVSDVRTVFSWSYRQLHSAQRLFRLLGLHPGPDIDETAAASLASSTVEQARAALTELVDSSLITEVTPGRYAVHDLMRDYAGELGDRTETPPERKSAVRRMLDHYLQASHAAAQAMEAHRRPPMVPAFSGPAPVVPLAKHDPTDWFTAEIATLLAVTRLAAEGGFHTHVWQLAANMHTFLHRRGNWHEAIAAHRRGLRAAERLGDVVALAHMHHFLGRAMVDVDHVQARHHLEQAYKGFSDLADTAAAARTQQIIGITFERQDDPERAMQHLHLALQMAASVDDAFLQGRLLNGLGWLYALLGDYVEARTHCQRALALMTRIGDDDGAADAWDSIGFALHHLDDHAGAVHCYQQAMMLYRALGHRYYLAQTLIHLGETQRAAGQADLARQAWQDALEICTDLRHPDGERVRNMLAELTVPAGDRPRQRRVSTR
ncbi:hypothetical protein Areg01_82890 [Actinoplanes regularis]|nr:hypothetical protein Areg01_82890 [Actinoplanes regularis]